MTRHMEAYCVLDENDPMGRNPPAERRGRSQGSAPQRQTNQSSEDVRTEAAQAFPRKGDKILGSWMKLNISQAMEARTFRKCRRVSAGRETIRLETSLWSSSALSGRESP